MIGGIMKFYIVVRIWFKIRIHYNSIEIEFYSMSIKVF